MVFIMPDALAQLALSRFTNLHMGAHPPIIIRHPTIAHLRASPASMVFIVRAVRVRTVLGSFASPTDPSDHRLRQKSELTTPEKKTGGAFLHRLFGRSAGKSENGMWQDFGCAPYPPGRLPPGLICGRLPLPGFGAGRVAGRLPTAVPCPPPGRALPGLTDGRLPFPEGAAGGPAGRLPKLGVPCPPPERALPGVTGGRLPFPGVAAGGPAGRLPKLGAPCPPPGRALPGVTGGRLPFSRVAAGGPAGRLLKLGAPCPPPG